ncbi:MAG: penicillin-binding transpeptidase domain-containing protein, partial [Patescibacteria group bacterium]
EIKNAEDKTYGQETMTEVLQNSDNIAMVWVSKKIGIPNQYSYLQKFGFGDKTHLGLVGESTGVIHQQKDWNETLSATAAFGQGFSLTVIQLANAYATLANEGRSVYPHLVAGTISGETIEPIQYNQGEQVIKKSTSKSILKMLEAVVLNGHGKKAQISGVRVGGKTGTAEVASASGGYDENKHIGTFAGVFPVNNPKYVMVVRLDDPKTVKFAESSAAPTFQIIGDWMANYFRLR